MSDIIEAWVNDDSVNDIKVYILFTLDSHNYLNKLNRHRKSCE